MKSQIVQAGNSLHNAGTSLIGSVVVLLFACCMSFANFYSYTKKDKQVILIALGTISLLLILYCGASLLKAGKILLNLEDPAKE